LRSVDLSAQTLAPTQIATGSRYGKADRPSSIGKWHALIASYDVSQQGCQVARSNFEEFGELLSSQSLGDHFVYVARTLISNNYAVTFDAGDDRELARRASRIIRARSVDSADGNIGAGSFVKGTRD
jgi:hypothetical protein